MATPGSLTIGGDSSRINSTQNSNNSSATRNKGENGFTILAFPNRMRHNAENRIITSKYFFKMCDPGEKYSYY